MVETLVRAGLVDVDWVAAQLGEALDDVHGAAVAAVREEVAPHPLLDPALLPRAGAADRSDAAALAAFLDQPGQRSPHPFLEPSLVPHLLDEAEATPGGLLALWLDRAADEAALPTSSLPRPTPFAEFRTAALDAARAWRSAHADGTTVHGRSAASPAAAVSVVVPLPASPRRVVDWLAGVPADDVEVVAVAGSSGRAAYVVGHVLSTLVERAVLVHAPSAATPTALLNAGIPHSTGGVVELARPDVQPTTDALRALAAATASPVAVAQPVVLDPERLVQSAGLVLTPSGGTLILAGHPRSDAAMLGHVAVPAVAAGLVAVRREVLKALDGLDESYEDRFAESDLSLRAAASGLGESRLVGDVTVRGSARYGPPAAVRTGLRTLRGRHGPTPVDLDALLAPAGLATAPASPAGEDGGLTATELRVVRSVSEAPPRLRWAIDIASPAAPRGDRWGDTHFAHSLAQALEQLGQHVAVDHREARDRASRRLDDVVLVLRGLDAVTPPTGPVTIQWLISHPDLVTREELAPYDLRYAASLPWARETSARWGLRIDPLLQCTDPARFHPYAPHGTDDGDALFVGNSRGEFRPVVRAALAAGVDLRLHGYGWEEFVGPGAVVSQAVPNEELGRLYAGARVVLADHHDDMRRDGFLANRLFDAAACGARVLSDEVEGIAETFHGLVVPFSDDQHLADLLTRVDAVWPGDQERLALAEQVANEHSFARRAATLLEAALAVRAGRTA
ncbi:MAG: glycosyltransferase [Nocardioides sp.]|uniref:glycosyltransferase family protein n=1 Tax=Nocardioides sp. TaxID=35761 RepID=UPI003EFEE5E5